MSTPSSHTSFPASGRPRRSDGHVTDLGRLLLGLCVVALGTLLLLNAAGVLDAGRAIDRWWPLVLVAAGVFTLGERPPRVVRSLLVTAAGTTLLLFTTDTVGDDAWSYVWPAAIIVAGLAILIRSKGRTIAAVGRAAEDDVVRSTAIFSGSRVVSSAQRFRGGWLTAIFGGVTLDLRTARLAPDGASINATAAFGGVEIVVPRGWRITIRSTPIFGGAEDKTDRSVPPTDDAPALRIDAVCVFGGVEVKHQK